MPPAKKETKSDEPLFVDEEGSYVLEAEQAKYHGGVRRYTHGASADGATAAAAAAPAAAAPSVSATTPPGAAAEGGQVLRHGRGTYACPSFHYDGGWVEDEMDGEGRLRFTATGNAYTGSFSHGCFNGFGTFTWGSGATYSGQWRVNRMHGEGVYTDADGHVWKGRYYNGTGPGLIRLYPTLERVE